MDAQGAGFAFTNADMDFSHVFDTVPQQQQVSMKPTGGETSGFFFGDEGVDTAASFIDAAVFSNTSQQATYAAQALILDNTIGTSSAWNSQMTPPMQDAINSFPPTPTLSFGSMYDPTIYSTALGKRPLPYDVQDMPNLKRHEMFADAGGLTAELPSPPATEMWPTQSAISFTTGVGLSEEAADMCATWFSKYAKLPNDKHIESLSQLTGESTEAIRSWFGRILKQGMAPGVHSDSAYMSQTGLPQHDQFWDEFSDVVQLPPFSEKDTQEATLTQTASTTPECVNETTTVTPPALQGRRNQRCTPTDDLSLLSRDANKIYQCTRKCGKRYGRKCDWKRNEEEGYPCKSWVCSLCTSQGTETVRPCFRKYHFAQHFRNIHPGTDCEEYQEASIVSSETEFPRNCGFCKHQFETRQERIDHIADHFKQGKCMLDWTDRSSDGSHGSDKSDDDDDDDRPSGNGFDYNHPSYKPPRSDPRGGFDSKFSGSDYYPHGGGAAGGYFQFQVSQLEGRGIGSPSSYAVQTTITTSDSRHIKQRPRATSEPLSRSTTTAEVWSRQSSTCAKFGSIEGVDQNAMAPDAVSSSVPSRPVIITVPSEEHQETQELGLSTLVTSGTSRQAPGKSTAKADTSQPVATPANITSGYLTQTQGLQPLPITSQSFLSVRLLGSGGFSTVDEVEHSVTKLRMSRKTLKDRDPAAIKELWKEVNVLQKLRHPHVIRLLGAYSRDDKMSILVSPIADTTLALWLDRFTQQQPSNLPQIITKIFGCLASSVRYLHEQRPVVKHMDIKPQNILVVEGDGEFPHVVLCDFGISSSEDLADGRSQPLTRRYAAPEMFESVASTQAADIWSLGCVFAEVASVTYGSSNSEWLRLRKEFSGRTGKYYWQNVHSLQRGLTTVLDAATEPTESTVANTLKSMLRRQPDERLCATELTMIFTPAQCCLDWPNDNATYPSPQEEASSVEMLLLEEGVASCAQHMHNEPVAGLSHSGSNAKGWLQQCSHSHEVCSHSTSPGTEGLPTRLVDLSPDGKDASYVRVIDSASVEASNVQVDYAALSHVWNDTNVSLSSDNLQALQAHLPRELLSLALQAAISAAQNLGIRYIWTDSLCVLQDNEDDKQRECANMATVFRNAALTLVLDQLDEALNVPASNTVEDPNTNENQTLASPQAPSVKPTSQFRLNASAALPTTDFTTLGFAWDTRAWALQERLLGSRFLHLGPEQMYWDCNSLKASDTFPQGLPSLVWEKVHSKPETQSQSLEAIQLRRTGDRASGTDSTAAAALLDHPSSIEPRRLRNCQWVKKEGDGLGDSMEAAQTTLELSEQRDCENGFGSTCLPSTGSSQFSDTQTVSEQARGEIANDGMGESMDDEVTVKGG